MSSGAEEEKKKAVITGRHKIRMEKGAWNGRREHGTRRVTRRVTRHSERRARGTMAPIGIDYLNYPLTPPPAVNRESGRTPARWWKRQRRASRRAHHRALFPRHGSSREIATLYSTTRIFDIYLCHCLNCHRHGGVNWIRSSRKRHRSIVPAEWERTVAASTPID